MAKQSSPTKHSPSDMNDEISSSSDNEQRISSNVTHQRDSIRNYVTNVLQKHGKDDEQQANLDPTHINIDTRAGTHRGYDNVSAFRQFQSNAEGSVRTGAERHRPQGYSSDDDAELRGDISAGGTNEFDESIGDLNLDPNPLIEERESGEKLYKQKVYLRQLQPPTPQPIEIQVQEVLIQSQTQKPPLHVRVGQREPRTPSPIIIKSAPPQPPAPEPDQPIVYNKYVPPPKQPPQQIVIHRYPDLPPKPRPIVVEQWLPYKPAPKRIIKHTLPREVLQTPPPPHNLLLSYAKPRALIQVELVRLPIVKVDPQTYQQMSAGSQSRLAEHPPFQHEQDYLSSDRLTRAAHPANQMNWRI